MVNLKIEFSNKKSKKYNGQYFHQNRNQTEKIIIYENANDKFQTLLHEILHRFFYKKSITGNRICQKINKEEFIIDSLATEIRNNIMPFVEIKI